MVHASIPYAFDLDFNAEAKAEEEVELEPTITVFEHEAKMAELERRIRAEAHATGRQEAMDEGANQLAEETQSLTAVAQRLLTQLDDEIGRREERGVRIAIAAARKLARRLLDKEPLGEVETLFRACLAPMFDASHLVVRIRPEHLDAIHDRLQAIAAAQGFEGRLVFLGDEEMAPGDARIEWADGGVARSQADLETSLDGLIEDYLAAKHHPPTLAPTQQAPAAVVAPPEEPKAQLPNETAQTNTTPLASPMEGAFDE
ncbi:MAG: hypothetical protein ACFB01_03130 [Cohaesibacteraceae bacterium]